MPSGGEKEAHKMHVVAAIFVIVFKHSLWCWGILAVSGLLKIHV